MKHVRTLALALAYLCVVAASASAQQGDRAAEVTTGGTYLIGPEDMLQIIVWKNESLSRMVQVRPDGMISLTLLNDVRAAGLTAHQLRDTLVKRFTDYMPTPEVSVIIQDVRSFKISILGEVLRPSRYDLKSRTTVLDAIALAGGFKDFASPSRIVILRTEAGVMKRIPFNYNKVVSGASDGVNFELQPYDIILVP
jgi:polysaccharide export outer membrane protein